MDSWYMMEDGLYWVRRDPSEAFERIVNVCKLKVIGDYLVNDDLLSDLLRAYPNLQLTPVEPADVTKAFTPPICKGVNL